MTLQGAYCDELTLFTEDFFSMLLSRLSEPKAKLFGTTNPDSPNHWIKTNYIDRQDELDLFIMQFLIEDNTTLDSSYVESLKKEYVGVFYNRFILGLWVIAEGLVYPMFDLERHVVTECSEPKDEYFEYYISIDYGTVNPCSMGLWRLERDRAIKVKELYFDSKKKKRQATDEEYYRMLEELAGDKLISCVIVDPSAASFIETVRRHGRFSVRKANNDVLDGIRVTGTLIQNNKVFIHKSCENTIREFGVYRWDDKANEDRVIKEFDHAMDETRYICNTILKKRLIQDV
jgi:PBSX family phage terminase large subunit